jgi:hypothetical protein
MSVEAVINQLESYVGDSYKWDTGAALGTLHFWLTANTLGPLPDRVTGGMQCFGLPFRAAYDVLALTWDRAAELYSEFLVECGMRLVPKTLCPGGVSMAGTSLPRGSVVMFSNEAIKYNAHFAVATGNGTNMVSFGHGANGLPAIMPVEIRDLDEINNIYNREFTACHFGTPCW